MQQTKTGFWSSDAWRSLGINSRRFVEFLLLEHMAKGGQQNGKLKAPDRQLREFGVDARYVAGAIREAEELGLVDCLRSGMRVATLYRLTWLEGHDGTPATNQWRTYRNPNLAPLPVAISRNLPDKGKAGLPDKGKADAPINLPDKGKVLLREFLPGRQPYIQKEKGVHANEHGSTALPIRRSAEPVSVAAVKEVGPWIGAPTRPDKADALAHASVACRRVACHTGGGHDEDYYDA